MQSWALLISLATFVLTLHLPAHFDYSHSGFQFEINRLWIVSPPIRYHLGVDGLSMWLVVLTGFLAPIGVLASWRAIDHAGQGVLFPLPAAADRDARRLPRA